MAKLSFKNRIIHLFTSHIGRLTIFSFLLGVGGVLGTDGLLEIKSQATFWDYVMYAGTLGLLAYFVYAMYYAVKNVISDLKGN